MILVSSLSHVILNLGFLPQRGQRGTAINLHNSQITRASWGTIRFLESTDQTQPYGAPLKRKIRKAWEKGLVWTQVFWHLLSPRYLKPHSLEVSYTLLVLKHLTTHKGCQERAPALMFLFPRPTAWVGLWRSLTGKLHQGDGLRCRD